MVITGKNRTLRVVLITLYMVFMGSLRTFIQLLIVGFNLNAFFTPPFLPLIPFALSASYVAAGLLIFKAWRVGSVLSIVAILAQISAEFYMVISVYGFFTLMDPVVLTPYSLDALILAYLIRTLWTETRPKLEGEEN